MKLIKHFLIYKLIVFIQSIYYYIKDLKTIGDTFYSNQFKFVIKRYLKCDIDKDWIGRLYGIINPNLDINGNIDVSGMIIEIDDNNTNNIEYIRNWIFRQLQLISSLFKIEKLYDYINLTIEHVGPKNHDNYLIVFDIASRKYMVNCLKSVIKHTMIYLILFIIILLCINLI